MTGRPQPGVFRYGTTAHLHLELDLVPGRLPDLDALYALAGSSGADVSAVVGFGPSLARRVLPESCAPALDGFADFAPVGRPEGPIAPATQHDLWVWLQASDHGELVVAGRRVLTSLAGVAVLAEEVAGFAFRTDHDLFAFEDGTENPEYEAAPDVACIPAGVPGAGGSYGFVQRWVHDLDAFDALGVHGQEQVIGRTRDGSVELEGDAQPLTSHVSRTAQDEAGEDFAQIWRRSTPYGTTSEAGLLYVAFASSPDLVLRQLERMYGVSADGVHDRIIEFSTAVTGANYFVPPLD